MKNIIRSKVMVISAIILLAVMSLKVDFENVLTLTGERFYNITGPRFLTFILPNNDTLVLADKEKLTLTGIESVIAIHAIEDYVLLVDGGWEKYRNGYQNTIPADKKVILVFRQIDEHKKEEFILAPLQIFVAKKDYFTIMKRIGSGIDGVIDKEISGYPDAFKILYECRRGDPRLRPFLTYVAYSLCGGNSEQVGLYAAAVSEITNMHHYAYNDVMDGKNRHLENNGSLVLASQVYSGLAAEMLCSFPGKQRNALTALSRLFKEDGATYVGQALDSDLTLQYAGIDETSFLAKYCKRSEALSGPMYGFSTWLGAWAAGATEVECEQMYTVGYAIGSAFQVVNDLSDFSALKGSSLSDLKNQKLTAPIFYLLKRTHCDAAELQSKKIGELQKLLIDSESFAKTVELAESYANEALTRINAFPPSAEKRMLAKVLRAVDENKHLKNIQMI